MDLNLNYYNILDITKDSELSHIKKSYYKLSFKLHPDRNKDCDISEFKLISEAWSILSDEELKKEYDSKSRWGKNYDEYYELFEIDTDFNYDDSKQKLEDFKKNNVNNIQIIIDDEDTFDGVIEYERFVKCKECDGSGKNLKAKILIRDNDGNVIKTFDPDDGCDFCFEENNNVITSNGPSKINNIKIGDSVLSSNGSYQEVTQLMDRKYSGDIYDIDVCGIKINGATPTHKFNVVRFSKNDQGRIKISDYDIMEVCANELTIDDFILYQKQYYSSKKSVLLPKTINRTESELLIDDDFIRFIACYISEGNTRGDRVTVMTLHIDKDKDIIEFIKKYGAVLGNDVKCFTDKAWGDKVLKIEIFNSQLSKFLKCFCGHHAVNKFINKDILGKSDQILLDTLLLCDGYKKQDSSLRTYTTISKKLGYQVLHLSLGLGHTASISKYKSYIDKNGVNHQACYRVYITYLQDMKKMSLYNKKIKEGICLKIRDIKKREVFNTQVYNITVDNTHKYTIDGLLVNNCEGTGESYDGTPCSFCNGQGKIGMSNCEVCGGEKRILGKQKLVNIKLTGEKTKLDAMGHYAKDGKIGYLLLVIIEKN